MTSPPRPNGVAPLSRRPPPEDRLASDWGELFDAASERLGQLMRTRPAPERHRSELDACAHALAELQQALPQVLQRCEQLETRAAQAEAALSLTRAELAGTQDGARRARHLALHDPLTQLPNRRYFLQRLQEELSRQPPARPTLALLYLDLDGFKPINDVHGHAVGDELLRIVASRLQRCVRSSDMVSRLGGDEFACLRGGPQSRQALCELADKLYQAVAAPLQIGAHALRVRPSIGLALWPADGHDADSLLHAADLAMYHAKRQQSRYAFHGELSAAERSAPPGANAS